MTTTPSSPRDLFTRKETVDKPGIIGARWWHEGAEAQVPRRTALVGLLAAGGVLGAVAIFGVRSCVSSAPDFTFEPRTALDMQRQYGWNFGATGETLVFDGRSTRPFDRAALANMATDLAPADARLAPYFVRTLFESPTAVPTAKPSGDPDAPAVTPLSQALVPIATPAMANAFEQGRALAATLDDPRAKDTAVIVDLPGPEAVAFAAGASGAFDPVFLFDNWPHPRGVVPAHLTLAAAAYYQPLFASAKTSRKPGSRPIFVLDRKRLATYTDDASQFDNRHTARLPSGANLSALGLEDLVYVGPNAVDREPLDDEADELLDYVGRLNLRVLPATSFARDASAGEGAIWSYRGSRALAPKFWDDWSAPPSSMPLNALQTYVPRSRKTSFSTGSPPSSGVPRPRPPAFGTVPVAVAVGTGVILGARLSRSGSWNRTYSTSSGS